MKEWIICVVWIIMYEVDLCCVDHYLNGSLIVDHYV